MLSPKKLRSGPISRGILPLLIATLLIPSAAFARLTLKPDFRFSQELDSNVFNRESADSDFVTRVAPAAMLEFLDDLGHMRLRGGLRSRSYADNSKLNAIDKFVNFDVKRSVTKRTTLTSKGTFDWREQIDQVQDADVVVRDARPDQTKQNVSLGFIHSLTPTTNFSFSGGFRNENWSSIPLAETTSLRRDSDSLFATAALTKALSGNDAVRATVGFDDTSYDGAMGITGAVAGEDTQTISILAGWARAWSNVLATDVNVGFRLLDIDTDSTATQKGGSESSTGLVGNLKLTRVFPKGKLELSVNQETRPGSGVSSSLDVREFKALYEGKLSERWSYDIQGSMKDRESASDRRVEDTAAPRVDLPDGMGGTFRAIACNDGTFSPTILNLCTRENNIDVRLFGAKAKLNWRVRKDLFSFLSFEFRQQESNGSAKLQDYDGARVMLGFRYAPPIDLSR